VVQLADGAAALDAHSPRLRIDAHPAHRRQVDEHLAVAGALAAADADGRNRQLTGEAGGGFRHDALEHQGEYAGLDQGPGTLEKGLGLLAGAAFFSVSAFFADALGQHSEMAADRDPAAHQGANFCGLTQAALEFHRVGPGLDEPAAVPESRFGVRIGADRQVGDDRGRRLGAGHGLGVMKHVREGHAGGVGETEHDHAERVADEQHIDARLVEQPRGRVVVGG
jgi:hypothetical protein